LILSQLSPVCVDSALQAAPTHFGQNGRKVAATVVCTGNSDFTRPIFARLKKESQDHSNARSVLARKYDAFAEKGDVMWGFASLLIDSKEQCCEEIITRG
jgi:hypothetical protein